MAKMLVYERHFSTPVIGGTGHAQCNICSCSAGAEMVSDALGTRLEFRHFETTRS